MVWMIIVDLEKQALAKQVERAEVMLAVRVIASVPIAETSESGAQRRDPLNREAHGLVCGFIARQQQHDAARHHPGRVHDIGLGAGEVVEAAGVFGFVGHRNSPQ